MFDTCPYLDLGIGTKPRSGCSSYLPAEKGGGKEGKRRRRLDLLHHEEKDDAATATAMKPIDGDANFIERKAGE
ncbi:hypothetical protein GW17_00032941 [Ensete ventricosum]|nr:hypothetical protein GW17_00032941 [Ensete ventricosum]